MWLDYLALSVWGFFLFLLLLVSVAYVSAILITAMHGYLLRNWAWYRMRAITHNKRKAEAWAKRRQTEHFRRIMAQSGNL